MRLARFKKNGNGVRLRVDRIFLAKNSPPRIKNIGTARPIILFIASIYPEENHPRPSASFKYPIVWVHMTKYINIPLSTLYFRDLCFCGKGSLGMELCRLPTWCVLFISAQCSLERDFSVDFQVPCRACLPGKSSGPFPCSFILDWS